MDETQAIYSVTRELFRRVSQDAQFAGTSFNIDLLDMYDIVSKREGKSKVTGEKMRFDSMITGEATFHCDVRLSNEDLGYTRGNFEIFLSRYY
jgi:hypothetical protein